MQLGEAAAAAAAVAEAKGAGGGAAGELEQRAAECEDAAVTAAREAAAAGALPRFGGGALAPKRAYSYEELKLNKVDPQRFLAPNDETLERLQRTIGYSLAAASLGATVALGLSPEQVAVDGSAFLFALGVDTVAYGGAGGALVLDSLARYTASGYRERVAAHEAGHFLVAYLVGILPRGYTLSGWDALRTYGALRVQAGCLFCDGDFQRSVSKGKLQSSDLDRYACVALAGIAAEVMTFGRAEGGSADVAQLDGLLRALGFDQSKATKQVRWAVLATVLLLREFKDVHKELALAMDRGASVSECIQVIEDRTDVELPNYAASAAKAAA
eukprot:PRCOL_00003025-RA